MKKGMIILGLLILITITSVWGSGRLIDPDDDSALVPYTGAIDNVTIGIHNLTSGGLFPTTTLTYDIGSGARRWRYLFVQNGSFENIDVSEDIVVGGNITGPFGDFESLFTGGLNLTNASGIFLNLSGTNANQNVNISPYNLRARGIILDDYTCLDFGARTTSICESGTDDIDIKSGGRIDVWTDTEISLRVDGDTNDYFHIETNDDIPTLRSYLSNMRLLADEGLITVTGNLTAIGYTITTDWGFFNNLNTTYLKATNLNVTGTLTAGDLVWDGDLNLNNNHIINVNNINATYFNFTTDSWFDFVNNNNLTLNTSKFDPTYHNPTQALAVVGTIDGGTLADVQHDDADYDGITFNFSEEVAGLDLRINFTGLTVTDFKRGIMRFKTSNLKGDFPIVQMWSYGTSEWEDYPAGSNDENL